MANTHMSRPADASKTFCGRPADEHTTPWSPHTHVVTGAVTCAHCVGELLSQGMRTGCYEIRLAAAQWSSGSARRGAMLPLALAKLDAGRRDPAWRDRAAWAQRLAAGVTRRVLPLALRAAAADSAIGEHAPRLRDVADKCERDGDAAAAEAAAAAGHAASRAVRAVENDAGRHYACPPSLWCIGYATHAAAWAGYAATGWREPRLRWRAAASAACAAAKAAYYPTQQPTARDEVLRLAVQVALDGFGA